MSSETLTHETISTEACGATDPGLQAGADDVSLPELVISLIIGNAIEHWKARECFQLRLVNRHFDQEVLRQLFGLFKINPLVSLFGLRWPHVDDLTAVRYWTAFIKCQDPCKSLTLDSHHRLFNLDMPYHHPHAIEQKNRSTAIHKSLNQAADVLHNMQIGESPDIYQHCITTVCKAAICLLGPDLAWTFIHAEPNLPSFELYRAGGYSKEKWCNQRLSTKNAAFWATLAVTYDGNFERLQSRLEPVKIHHQSYSGWLARMTTTYYKFCDESSPDERDWVDLLSACLTIAVNRGHVQIVEFLLKQDPATSTEMFQSCNFNGEALLTLAIRNCSIGTLNALLDSKWLQPSPMWMFRVRYETALIEAAGLDPQRPGRDEVVSQLLNLSRQWQSTNCTQIILAKAATRNDVRFAEMVVAALGTNNAGDNFDFNTRLMTPQTWSFSPNDRCPLSIAACLGHLETFRYLLQHSQKLRIWDMVDSPFEPCNFKSRTIKNLVEQCESPDPTILTELLDQSGDLRLEQVQILTRHLTDKVDRVNRFFEHVDIHSPAIQGEQISLGEHALIAAVFQMNIEFIQHLIETYDIEVTQPVVLVPCRKLSGEPSNWLSTFKVQTSQSQDELRTYLTGKGISVNGDRTVIWPSHAKLSISWSEYKRSAITGLDYVDDLTCTRLGWKVLKGRGQSRKVSVPYYRRSSRYYN